MGKTCSFFGHRKIINGVEIAEEVKAFVEKLIVEEEFTTFLFGEFGEVDELCFDFSPFSIPFHQQHNILYLS